MKKNIKFYKKIIPLVMASTLSLTGCGSELGSDVSDYDVLSTSGKENNDNIFTGVEQLLDVHNEEFKLKVIYSTKEKEWRITSDKELNIEVYTVGLPSNLSVYIDNVHTDTSIISTKAEFDGIEQDSMDDQIHNSQMLGFPISDTVSYYGINEINGENQEFVSGYLATGSLEQKRLLESDFLSSGVWANRIDSIFDLIVVDNDTDEVRTMSVSSTIIVEVNNKITYKSGQVRVYDKDGDYKKITK